MNLMIKINKIKNKHPDSCLKYIGGQYCLGYLYSCFYCFKNLDEYCSAGFCEQLF